MNIPEPFHIIMGYKGAIKHHKGAKKILDLINCFETPTVNLYLELSVVIYFKEFKVSSSSDKLPRFVCPGTDQ